MGILYGSFELIHGQVHNMVTGHPPTVWKEENLDPLFTQYPERVSLKEIEVVIIIRLDLCIW